MSLFAHTEQEVSKTRIEETEPKPFTHMYPYISSYIIRGPLRTEGMNEAVYIVDPSRLGHSKPHGSLVVPRSWLHPLDGSSAVCREIHGPTDPGAGCAGLALEKGGTSQMPGDLHPKWFGDVNLENSWPTVRILGQLSVVGFAMEGNGAP